MNTSKSTRARLQGLNTSTAFIAAVILAAPQTVWAGGSNTSSPATPPVAPPPVVTTNAPGTGTAVGQGGCAQSYLGAISQNANNALISTDAANASSFISAQANVAALIAQATASSIQGGALEAAGAGLDEAAAGVITPLDAAPA